MSEDRRRQGFIAIRRQNGTGGVESVFAQTDDDAEVPQEPQFLDDEGAAGREL
jgi:hypothetical protein